MIRMKPFITSSVAVVMFAGLGLSQELPNSASENGNAGIWKPMVFDGRELLPSLRTRKADEPVWHMRSGFVLPRNPYVSTNEEIVEGISRSSSQGRIPGGGIQSALYAAYGDEDKRVLLRGLEAASDRDASWREAALRDIWAKNMRFGNIRIHRKGTLLVVVWHQGLSPESWEAVNASVAKRLGNGATDNLSVLEGTLKVHPKFAYRFYLDGLANGQSCGLTGMDNKLKDLQPGTRIRVRGTLHSRHFEESAYHQPNAALIVADYIYMDVKHLKLVIEKK